MSPLRPGEGKYFHVAVYSNQPLFVQHFLVGALRIF